MTADSNALDLVFARPDASSKVLFGAMTRKSARKAKSLGSDVGASIGEPLHVRTLSKVRFSVSESAGGGAVLSFLWLVLVEPDSEG